MVNHPGVLLPLSLRSVHPVMLTWKSSSPHPLVKNPFSHSSLILWKNPKEHCYILTLKVTILLSSCSLFLESLFIYIYCFIRVTIVSESSPLFRIHVLISCFSCCFTIIILSTLRGGAFFDIFILYISSQS